MTVGKSEKPRAIKDVKNRLPVEYYGGPADWFSQDIVEERLHRHSDPDLAVRNHQDEYGIKSDDVQAFLILSNAPAHPSASRLCSKHRCMKTLFLPPSTTSMIQHMDQGIVESANRHCRNIFLKLCLIVVEDGMDEPGYVECRVKKTKGILKAYTVKDVIFN